MLTAQTFYSYEDHICQSPRLYVRPQLVHLMDGRWNAFNLTSEPLLAMDEFHRVTLSVAARQERAAIRRCKKRYSEAEPPTWIVLLALAISYIHLGVLRFNLSLGRALRGAGLC